MFVMLEIPRKVAFYTLGCKLNFTETAALMRQCSERGFLCVPFGEPADYVVINTCSVTHTADKKSRQAIAKAIKTGGKIIVTGCYAQLRPEEFTTVKNIVLITGMAGKEKIIDYLYFLEKGEIKEGTMMHSSIPDTFFPAHSLHERTRAFLKVQDGCDYHCAYCTVPLARGKSRNPFIRELVDRVKEIAAHGLKEIVLTGVNTGDFGKTTGETFYELLQQLIKVDGIERYRISSIEPELLTEQIVVLVAETDRIAHHFHLPLQSGSNRILALMQRRYNKELYASRIHMIKKYLPYASVGADVIVGFPGETDKDFQETFEFVKKEDISYLHVFPYSERPGTKAASMPDKVPYAEKEARAEELLKLSVQKKKAFYLKNEGRMEKVIFEKKYHKGKMIGFTSNYIEVESPFNNAFIGEIIPVKLIGVRENGLMEADITGITGDV